MKARGMSLDALSTCGGVLKLTDEKTNAFHSVGVVPFCHQNSASHDAHDLGYVLISLSCVLGPIPFRSIGSSGHNTACYSRLDTGKFLSYIGLCERRDEGIPKHHVLTSMPDQDSVTVRYVTSPQEPGMSVQMTKVFDWCSFRVN